MKTPIIALITLAACAALTRAQDVIDPEKLQKVVGRLMERASDQENLPLTMEVDSGKAMGMTVKEYGAVVLPAKSLSADALAKAGNEIIPVGFLWMKGLVPSVDGKPVVAEKLRPVKVVVEQEEHSLQLLSLGLRKSGEAGLELVVLAKNKEAVLTLPLKEETRDQSNPVELEMRQGTESLGLIDVHVLGKLHAVIPVEQP